MSTSENEILDKLEYNPEQGVLEFNGVRYLVMRPETVMGFFRAVAESMGARAGELAYEGGYQGGSASTSTYKSKFNLTNLEILEYMCNMGAQLGWGKFQIDYDSDERLEISVRNSPFAHEDALTDDSENGSCHFIRGVLAGLGKTVLESEVLATEPECVARGKPQCLFVIERAGVREKAFKSI